jgi:hemoglobin
MEKMDSREAYARAQAIRAVLQQSARDIGVNEEYIATLVETFYDNVRRHPDLGPVFNDAIQDRWPIHLPKMKLFWQTIALRTGEYKGDPMQVHKELTQAKPEHFSAWLTLFEQTLKETAPNQEVVDFFMRYARTMAQRLQSGMFGVA